MTIDRRYWGTTLAVFALHMGATLAATHLRTGFYLFTIPIVVPIVGAESYLGRAVWLFLFDAGAVAVVRTAAHLLTVPESETAEPPNLSHLNRLGHLAAAAGIAVIAALLVFARDSVFVVSVMQPTLSGVYGVVKRPIFTDQMARYVPAVLVGAGFDIIRHLVFAATDDVRARLIARALARLVTAAVLIYLATGSVFNLGGFGELGALEAWVGRIASFALLGLGLVAAFAALADQMRLANLYRSVDQSGAGSAPAARTDGGASEDAPQGRED